jgi:hypothetical protein
VERLANLRMDVLAQAIVRLDFGFNPPDVLAKWAADRPAEHGDSNKLPGVPQLVSGEVVARVFPDLVWCSTFKGFSPVARVDEGESTWPVRNLFAIDRKSEVTHITDAAGLKAKFIAKAVIRDAEGAKAAVAAWLILTQTLQDHSPFPVVAESLKFGAGRGGATAQGRAASGTGPGPKLLSDSGFIEATLTFDARGELTDITETVKFRPGIRPICQSTKLLDRDPIVRTMAERELRLMGRSAEGYLKARRAAASPELRAAIDRVWQEILQDERDFGWTD